MKILIATHNQSKLKRYQKILKSIGLVDLISLNDIEITEKADENFATNTENALHKARTYGDLSGLITVAIDEALMTNFLPDNEQPGVYARRFTKNKAELTDQELTDVWKEIFNLYPQTDKKFIWSFAVAYYNPNTKTEGVECVEQISYVAKYFSDVKHTGYPMSSFLSPTKDGKPYTETSDEENDQRDLKIFSNFTAAFKKWLK